MPSRTLVSYLECAGNHRAMFDLVKGQKASGTQWRTGGVGNGEWTGVSLRDVLRLAGVTDDAANVLLIGLDTESPEEGFRRVLSAEKALHPDTLLAYGMNGETLPRDHGFPLRALVPGWVGSTNVKWLGRIVVSKAPIWTRNNTTSYVLIGDDYPPEGEAAGKVTTTQVIKSALALPWPAELERCVAADPRVCALAGRADREGGVERGLGQDVEAGGGADAAGAVLVGAVRVWVGSASGRVHDHDAGHGRGREYAAGGDSIQREGVPVQPAAAASGDRVT